MKTCFVSIDVESDFAENKSFEGVEKLDKILRIFKKNKIAATLFVTGNVLEKYLEKVREWSEDYEIACHSFSHRFWDTLSQEEREDELKRFIKLYREVFKMVPKGFRAPSHIIDEKGIKLLAERGFLYDSSIVPHYPFFKNYRGYKGKAPLKPYWYNERIFEIPITGQLLGVPVAGTWISKLPSFIFGFLFGIYSPVFLTFNLHSWDSLNDKLLIKIEKILKLLKDRNYYFLTGLQVYETFSKS